MLLEQSLAENPTFVFILQNIIPNVLGVKMLIHKSKGSLCVPFQKQKSELCNSPLDA